MTFPSDQHVGLVGVTLLGCGLVGVAIAASQENAVIAAIGGVVQIGTGIVGFLGGRAVGRAERPESTPTSTSTNPVTMETPSTSAIPAEHNL